MIETTELRIPRARFLTADQVLAVVEAEERLAEMGARAVPPPPAGYFTGRTEAAEEVLAALRISRYGSPRKRVQHELAGWLIGTIILDAARRERAAPRHSYEGWRHYYRRISAARIAAGLGLQNIGYGRYASRTTRGGDTHEG